MTPDPITPLSWQLGESSVVASRHLGESSVVASRHLGESSVVTSRHLGESSIAASRHLGESSVIASRHLGENSVVASRHLGESSVVTSRLNRNVFYVSSTFVTASQISTCDFWFTETLRPESDTIQRRVSLIRSKRMSLTSLLRTKTERPLSISINQTRGVISILSFSQMRGQKLNVF